MRKFRGGKKILIRFRRHRESLRKENIPEEPVLTPSVTEIRAYAANFGTRFRLDPCKEQNRENCWRGLDSGETYEIFYADEKA